MKNADQSMERLLRAAGQYHRTATAEEAPSAPFGFATRVAAGWLAGEGRERGGLEVLWFRRALLCALALAAVTVGWSYKSITAAPNEEMAIASYDASTDLP